MKKLVTLAVGLLALTSVPEASAWYTNDWEFLDTMQQASFRFFRDEKVGPHDLLNDHAPYDNNTWVVDYTSVAGIGFEMTAACLGHYRGWLSYSDAYHRVLHMARAFDGQLSTNPGIFHKENGWTHHTYYTIGEQAGTVCTGVAPELSLLDHSMLIAGCIFASEYFKGTEAAEIAHKIYADTTWSWRPDNDYNFGYSEDLLAIIESAEAPQFKKGTNAYVMWRDYCVPPWPRKLQLYFWEYPHSWIDFRFRTDAQRNDNHAIVAQQSILYQRDRAMAMNASNAVIYDMVGSNCWGWSAAFASDTYRQMAPWPLDTNDNEEYRSDSGSITPFALPPCMVYAPGETMAAMKYIFEEYYIKGWDPGNGEKPVWSDIYGWLDCLNDGQPWNTNQHNWYYPIVACIDHGPNVLMLENYKMGTTWRYFMQNPYIRTGMYTVGFSATTNTTHADFSGPTNQFGGGLGAWHNDATPVWVGYVDVGYVNDEVQGYVARYGADHDNEGGWIDLGGCDQRAQAMLSFWARADSTNVQIQVGLVDRQWNENKVALAGYAGGSTPTNWTQVRIPLERFCLTGSLTNDTWLGNLDKVTFAFTNTSGGTLDIDYLAFTADTVAPAAPQAGFGMAQEKNHTRLRWDPSGVERDVAGYHVWRRYDGTSGFTRATRWLIPAYEDGHEDMTLVAEPGQQVRYALQSCDNAEPQNGSAYTYEKLVTGGRLDVDWNNGQNPNALGGNFDGYWGPATTEAFDFVQTSLPCGMWGWTRRSLVGAPSGGHFIYAANCDLGDYGALSLWIKGAQGGEGLEIGLKDSSFYEIKVDASQVLDTGGVTTEWGRAVIPFSDFPGVNVTSLDNISFTHTTSGEVFIAELGFLIDERYAFSGDYFAEAEHCTRQQGSRTRNALAGASAGEVLGADWGMHAGDYADFEFLFGRERTGMTLRVRYACQSGDGRTFDVRWDDSVQGGLTCTNTGGWGNESSHFSWAETALPGTSTGFHKLTLYANGSNDAVNLDCLYLDDAPPGFYECEAYDSQIGSGGQDLKPGASDGEVLGWSWGLSSNSEAVYNSVAVGNQTGAWCHLWYAIHSASYSGRMVEVYLDGVKRADLVCVGTAGWGDRAFHFERASAFVGALAAGVHTVRLAVAEAGVPVNLDCFYVGGRGPDRFGKDGDDDGLSDRQEAITGTGHADADTDDDGIADGDELQYGRYGQVTDPKNADADQDGMNDLQESIAGTDPWDGGSVFTCTEASAGPDGFVITWPSVADRWYTLLRTTNLLGSITFSNILEDAAATPGENSYTDNVQGIGPYFYRVRVRK